MAIVLNTLPYCNCHATGKWQRQDGYSLDPPSGLWVHGRCRKPSKMNYERFVLGINPIPQQRRPMEDIYEIELLASARKEVEAELNWDPELEKEESFELSFWHLDEELRGLNDW